MSKVLFDICKSRCQRAPLTLVSKILDDIDRYYGEYPNVNQYHGNNIFNKLPSFKTYIVLFFSSA
jgi:hypothetical protein